MDSSVGCCIATQLSNANRDHFDGLGGIVVAGANFGNLFDKVQVFNDLSKDGVGTRGRSVEPVKEAVVVHVDEELGASRFRSSCVRHAESSNIIGNLLVGFSNFIGNSTVMGALVSLSIAALEGAAGNGSSGSGTGAVGILRVGATELVHKVGDHTVEVDAIVESRVGKVDEVAASDWHFVGIQLGLEGTHRCGESSSFGHGGDGLQFENLRMMNIRTASIVFSA